MSDRKRLRLLNRIHSLNLVLDTFNLPDEERGKLQRRKMKCIEELARMEQVKGRLKPWALLRRK